MANEPTSQDSPLPAKPPASLPRTELLPRRFPIEAVGDSLLVHPPMRAIDRTERIARTAMEPFFGCGLSSPSGVGVDERDLGGGTGEVARLSVEAEEIDAGGGP